MENMGRAGVGETITRAQLTEAIYQEVGLSRNESADLVESVLAEMSDALVRGEMVKLSSFGSFALIDAGSSDVISTEVLSKSVSRS